jgi:hypothetical protein
MEGWRDHTGRAIIRPSYHGRVGIGRRPSDISKAEELETAYRENYGLEEIDDDDYDDEDSDTGSDGSIGVRDRRYHSGPTGYSNTAKKKTTNRSRYETSEGSDIGSNASMHSRNSRHRRHRSGRVPHWKTTRRQKAEKDEDVIRKLEREIQGLKIGRSTSPEDKRRVQPRTQRRRGRERTV